MKLVKIKVSQKQFHLIQTDKQEKKMEAQRRGIVNLSTPLREPGVSQLRREAKTTFPSICFPFFTSVEFLSGNMAITNKNYISQQLLQLCREVYLPQCCPIRRKQKWYMKLPDHALREKCALSLPFTPFLWLQYLHSDTPSWLMWVKAAA